MLGCTCETVLAPWEMADVKSLPCPDLFENAEKVEKKGIKSDDQRRVGKPTVFLGKLVHTLGPYLSVKRCLRPQLRL